jgi:hypothetical protein
MLDTRHWLLDTGIKTKNQKHYFKRGQNLISAPFLLRLTVFFIDNIGGGYKN